MTSTPRAKASIFKARMNATWTKRPVSCGSGLTRPHGRVYIELDPEFYETELARLPRFLIPSPRKVNDGSIGFKFQGSPVPGAIQVRIVPTNVRRTKSRYILDFQGFSDSGPQSEVLSCLDGGTYGLSETTGLFFKTSSILRIKPPRLADRVTLGNSARRLATTVDGHAQLDLFAKNR
jgi:hypothetical protein